MKRFGILLLLVGSLWALVAFNTDTTVATEGFVIGDTYIPSKKVHNIGMMDERRNSLMLSGLVVIVGVILFSVGNNKKQPSELPAEQVKIEDSKNRRYHGERNVQIGKYQLFLTEKYLINKNETLEKYVIDDNLFDTLEESLRYADNKEEQEIEAMYERLKSAYLISSITKNSNASLSGVKVDDVLLAYNETLITDNQDIDDAIYYAASEKNAKLAILRDGEKIIIEVNPGRLGIDGELVALDESIYEERIKNFKC